MTVAANRSKSLCRGSGGPHDPLGEQGRHSLICCTRRSERPGLQSGHAQPRESDLVGVQQRRLQPSAFVAQRLIRGSIFPKPVRGTIRRKVPHESEVSAPDFSIVGTLAHAENSEWIAHQNGILRAVAPCPRRPPSIAVATIASQNSRNARSG